MNDLMFDIETLSTDCHNGIMFCFGAVFFDRVTGQVGEKTTVYLNPAVDGRSVEMDTLVWWLKTDAPLLDNLLAKSLRVQDNRENLKSFVHWVGGMCQSATLWAGPTTFDIPFLFSYLKQYNVPWGDVFNRRRVIDCRSYCLGRGIDYKPQAAHAHNPVDDCLAQIAAVTRV